MKILLAIDDSKFSEAALQMVLTLYRHEETEVRVLHVAEPIALTIAPLMAQGYAPELEKVRKDQSKQAQELVAQAAQKLCTAGFQVDTAVYEGNARTVIVDLAAEWHADMIVVGRAWTDSCSALYRSTSLAMPTARCRLSGCRQSSEQLGPRITP